MIAVLDRIAKSASQRVTRNVSLEKRKSRLTAPLASFSFDDVPRSAWTNGAPIIEAVGGRATYYVAGKFCGTHEDGQDYVTRDDVRQMAARGHEVGCHTFDHLRLGTASGAEIDATLAKNEAFIREVLGDFRFGSFAYPYGDADLRSKAIMGDRFPLARGIHAGVNAGAVDMAQLKAIPIETRNFGQVDFDGLIAQAKATNGWLVFFGHDVREQPTAYGCTPEQLSSIVGKVKDAGIEILPVKSAAARVVFG